VGQDIDAANVLTRLKGFTQRPGWSDLPAVHDGRVYAVYHGATRSIMDAALLQFMAKALYPALFKDLDPKATYLGFYQRYLPIRPHGTFMLGLNGRDQIEATTKREGRHWPPLFAWGEGSEFAAVVCYHGPIYPKRLKTRGR
ncbi:MAG: hypothetical protein ACRC8D_16905, partial [Aeromonas sp.]